MAKATGTQALERAIALIEMIAAGPAEGMKLAEIAVACAVETPTAHRIVASLERKGLVGRVGDSRRLCIGPKFFQIAIVSAEGGGLLDKVKPALLRIAARTGDCVFFMTRSGLDAICLDRQDGDYTISSLTGRIGGATPLGLGTGSLTILAHLPDDERSAVLASNRDRIGALGYTSPSDRGIVKILRQGYNYEVGFPIAGIAGLAVPVLTPKGRPLGALALGATEARLPAERLKTVLPIMLEEANRIQSAAGSSRAILEGR